MPLKAVCIAYLLFAAGLLRAAEPIRCVTPGAVETVAFSPDGKTVASGGADRMVRIWDATDGKQLQELPIYDSQQKEPEVTYVAFSPDGATLAVGARGKPITFWNLASAKKLDQTLPVNQVAWSVAFSPDGTYLAVVDPSDVKVWDLSKQKTVFNFRQSQPGNINVLKLSGMPHQAIFSPDGTLLGTDSEYVWKWAMGEKFIDDQELSGRAATFSTDGKLLVVGGRPYYNLSIWSLQTKKKILERASQKRGMICCVATCPDSKTIASGGETIGIDEAPDTDVRLWDIETGDVVGLLQGHTKQVVGLSFSPDGKKLAGASQDKTVIIWNLETDIVKPSAN